MQVVVRSQVDESKNLKFDLDVVESVGSLRYGNSKRKEL